MIPDSTGQPLALPDTVASVIMDAVPEEALAPPGTDVTLPMGGNPGPLGVAPQPVPGALGGLGGLGPSVTDPPLHGYGGGMPP
mmetsp:Transcript_25885/g.77739  ORF Transcript_25885/g.77739 Transcript_25885/m.77739 type:complete len:83 (-) Transcript_25885:14-262(-)